MGIAMRILATLLKALILLSILLLLGCCLLVAVAVSAVVAMVRESFTNKTERRK